MARKQTQKFRHPFPILIAEDHPTTRGILEKILINIGYETVSVGNGREALELFKERFFPIIMADWMMPEMDGIELCRAIRENTTSGYVYVILLSAKDSKDDVITGLEAGADDFLTKPFSRAELIARLNSGKRIVELERSLRKANELSRQEIEQRRRAEQAQEQLIQKLRALLGKVKTLSGLLPICAYCKNIRNDKGYWSQIETYIEDHSEADFSHSVCPKCAKELSSQLKNDNRRPR
jgi:DNA-binding response OmpR family regulator